MQDGSKPGDGKTAPFGDGKGATGGMAGGNDFVKNPLGGGNLGGGNDFVENPLGNGPRPAGATPARTFAQKRATSETNPQDAARTLSALDDATPRSDTVGSVGNDRKPFRLNG